MSHISRITDEFKLKIEQVKAVSDLLEKDATIPFIARYRKEMTGSLDEVVISGIRDRLSQLQEIDARREAVLKSLEQHDHLTDALKEKVMAAETLAILEDIYLPYRPKRRTRATIAREKGLEPLAELIFEQSAADLDPLAESFVDSEKGVASVEDALAGARDIIAEKMNEDERARARLRRLFGSKGKIISKVIEGMEVAGAKYRDYFDLEEPVGSAPSHRILAMRRGENENMLNMTISPKAADAIAILEELFVTGDGQGSIQVCTAASDSYKRLLSRSLETEMRVATKERADRQAILVFADNLRQVLMAPPLGAKRVMGIDPGFRTGCKVVCLDPQGKLLHHDAIFPHLSDKKKREAADTLERLCETFHVEAIAVGNGTAGRETETFIRALPFSKKIQVIMVNESGASIYSASGVAREEFPDHDVTVRGSVSIGRRLMDPLSELVKIDPKSIGVGQYQHDVDQNALKQSLDDVVMSCVNSVGVEVNRASAAILTYVSGLGPGLAKSIVAFRDKNGPFTQREQLMSVPRLGPKAFEQSAGFLRIRDGENALDASAVHPESYPVVHQMARDLDCSIADLMKMSDLKNKITVSDYVTDAIGAPTLNDILSELVKPGRDPRQEFEEFSFAGDIQKIEDVKPGMKLPGIVTNITAFGAFVDIGVHQDGLVHISQLADRFVKDPGKVVKVHQKVNVTVLNIDLDRKRIGLSMKSNEKPAPSKNRSSRKPAKRNSAAVDRKKESGNKTGNRKKPFNNPFADLFS
jgi:uncharacterized protein